ncbi:PRC-barrel domain-containing protein [Falsirhodobacter deserti]|uniref:PRC-barrel domain-containing protein n=1 Tax=Falsirhodobacter deserti TaxID=1365611 RepID=UPI0013E37DD8|nr:PRC-barrel domain-containing protein [Falsirhodobacter deserti]
MKIVTPSLIALMLAAGAAHAQDAGTVDLTSSANLVSGDELEDGTVYSVATGIDQQSFEGATYTTVESEWEKVGEIEDVVLDSEGKLVAIEAEIGGFLGLGDRHVLLPVSDLALVAGKNRDFSYVTRLSQEELRDLPELDRNFWE